MTATLEPEVAAHTVPPRRRRARRVVVGLASAGSACALAACGSTSGSGAAASSNPQTLLKQTFASNHAVKSGVLDFSLVITPKGSSELTTPLKLTLHGPFQSRGKGQTPESALTIGFDGLGKSGSLGVTTTGGGAYVRIEGANYQLPASQFKRLSKTLSSGSSKSAAPGLSTLGINPESWLTKPEIVGTQTVDGVVTEHLHASVNVSAFVSSLNTALAKESSALKSAGAGAKHITPAMAQKIAAAIRNPTVDVWTGKNDTTLRRMQISATVPVSGSMSSELGGLTSASLRLTVNYSELGQAQTITAPGNVKSYAALQQKLEAIGQGLSATFGGSSLGSTGTTGTAGTTGTTGTAGSVSKYAKCINGAAHSVAKMQKCAKLLNAAG